MRMPLLRPGLPLAVLLLAVFVQAALGSILACHTTPHRPVVTAAVVAPAAVSATCADCLLEGLSAEVAQRIEVPAESGTLPVGWDPCTPDRPCQHGPVDGYGAGDTAVRTPDGPRAFAPAAQPLSLRASFDARNPAAVPSPSRAGCASFASLCVDRN